MMTKIYPRTGDNQTVYLNAVIKDTVIIADFSSDIFCIVRKFSK